VLPPGGLQFFFLPHLFLLKPATALQLRTSVFREHAPPRSSLCLALSLPFNLPRSSGFFFPLHLGHLFFSWESSTRLIPRRSTYKIPKIPSRLWRGLPCHPTWYPHPPDDIRGHQLSFPPPLRRWDQPRPIHLAFKPFPRAPQRPFFQWF